MPTNQKNHMDRIFIQPQIILNTFTLKNKRVESLEYQREIGPFAINSEEVFLEASGSIIAKGILRITDGGAEFTITGMAGEE